MKKQIMIIALVLMFNIFLVSAETALIFKQDEEVNFRFRCLDADNNYCSSATQLQISIEYPNGSNSYDNSSMTYNLTYFNHTLDTSLIGEYIAIILSPTVNGTISEFSYEVTSTGEKVSLSNIIIVIVFLVLCIAFLYLGSIFEADKWMIKTAFYLFAILMGVLAVNSGRIIASESTDLSTMATTGFVLVIAVLSILFLYIFIYATVQAFKQIRHKKEVRWNY